MSGRPKKIIENASAHCHGGFGFRSTWRSNSFTETALPATMAPTIGSSTNLTVSPRAEVAKDVLTHPLISDSIFSLKPQWLADRVRLAKAVHPDELVAILNDLSTKPAYAGIAGLPAEINVLINAQNLAADRRLTLLTGSPALAALPVAGAVPLLQDTVNSIKAEC